MEANPCNSRSEQAREMLPHLILTLPSRLFNTMFGPQNLGHGLSNERSLNNDLRSTQPPPHMTGWDGAPTHTRFGVADHEHTPSREKHGTRDALLTYRPPPLLAQTPQKDQRISRSACLAFRISLFLWLKRLSRGWDLREQS